MQETRDWREAKLPQWARDAMQAEIDQWRMTAALAWPTQAKPQPLPFGWGEYDRLFGTPTPGTFWAVGESRIDRFDLARALRICDPKIGQSLADRRGRRGPSAHRKAGAGTRAFSVARCSTTCRTQNSTGDGCYARNLHAN